MLDELRRGKNVRNRQLGTWLTEDEYESFESDWESQQQIREELRDKPDELKRYENKLDQPTFINTRAGSRFLRAKKPQRPLTSHCRLRDSVTPSQ
jgi:hypothetical protein